MPKPRVLFVLGALHGDNGINSHLTTLAKGLNEQGWEVALASGIFLGKNGPYKEIATRAIQNFESYGFKHFFIQFPELRFFPKNIVSAFESLIKLDRIIHQFKPNVIHVHSLSLTPYIQVMKFLHRIPSVSSCHIEPNTDRLDIKAGAFVNERFNTFLGDRVIAISSALKDALENNMRLPKDNIRLIYFGIENERFRPPSPEERLKAREAFELAPESKVICLIGNLSPIKGHDVLIRALSILRFGGIDMIALCAGKGFGEDEDLIRAYAAKEGVSDLVRLLGFTDARQVLWASDAITLPSRREGFSLVIPEAMLCGVVPVRTPAAGASDQIQDGVDGFIVPFEDPEALALRLKQLFENDLLRSQMSAAALESAQRKFTVDRMAKNTILVYKEVID